MKESKKNKNTDEPAKRKPVVEEPEAPERRNFVVGALAVVVGAIVGLFPPLAGLAMLFDPLRRKSQFGQFIPVATLDEVPADGIPRSFPVIADLSDAWNFYPKEHIGAVYLRRTEADETPKAVSAICPHLGCFVDFRAAQSIYKCPCHDSSFEPDGKRINPDKCPAARDLDSLEVDVRGNEVWVKFQKFKGSNKEKIPEV